MCRKGGVLHHAVWSAGFLGRGEGPLWVSELLRPCTPLSWGSASLQGFLGTAAVRQDGGGRRDINSACLVT